MRKIFQQFLIAMVVFSLVWPGELGAKARKPGAYLRITKTDGSMIEGELLAVKPESLLIMKYPGKSGHTIAVSEIARIKIRRKSVESRFWKAAFIGASILAPIGFGLGYLINEDSYYRFKDSLHPAYIFALWGGFIGGPLGASRREYKKIRLAGKPSTKKEKILNKLKKMARFKDTVPDNLEQVLMPEPVSSKINRIHLSLDHGYFKSAGLDDYANVFKETTVDDETVRRGYPWILNNRFTHLKNLKIEFSINKKIALGFTYSTPQKLRLQEGQDWEAEMGTRTSYVTGVFRVKAYFLTAAYMPLTGNLKGKSTLKAGGGAGLSDASFDFRTNFHGLAGGSFVPDFSRVAFSKKSLCLMVFGEYNYYFLEHFSFGLNVDYKYMPVSVDPFQMFISFGTIRYPYYIEFNNATVSFPKHRVNFGGIGFGISLGIHF